ncbi:MAG: polysaccharide biosynthesis/export family protein [bacterium]
MYKRIILTLLALSIISTNVNNAVHAENSKLLTCSISQLAARSYILGPNDVISISVYDSPEFEQKSIRVQPNGTIVVSPLGVLNVSGMSISELDKVLYQKYKYYLNDPQITINLERTKSFIVYVSGAVQNPGSYELNTDTSTSQTQSGGSKPETLIERKTPLLSNILVASGGLSYDADLEHVKITNNFDKSEFEVNLFKMIENGDTTQDIYLIAGDSIYIPKLLSPFAIDEKKYKKYMTSTIAQREIPVRVFGYVNNPGQINLNSSKSLYLNSAIIQAGGYPKDSAYAPSYVYLSRIDNNDKLITKKVDPMNKEIVLYPNDLIYVPEKPRPLFAKAFDYTTRLISPFNGVANTYNNWALVFKPLRYQVIGK